MGHGGLSSGLSVVMLVVVAFSFAPLRETEGRVQHYLELGSVDELLSLLGLGQAAAPVEGTEPADAPQHVVVLFPGASSLEQYCPSLEYPPLAFLFVCHSAPPLTLQRQ